MNNTILITQAITGLKHLSENDIYPISKIEWWLLKYEADYQDVKSIINAIPNDFTLPRISKKYHTEYQFIDLFERLQEVSICHRNETYFKEQLALYDEVKNNVSELNNWLATHYLGAGEQQSKFGALFFDNRELTDYNFNIYLPISLKLSIVVDATEFQYSLQFLNILERSKKMIITGIVKLIDDIEIFEERRISNEKFTRVRPAFKRQKVVISTNDEHLNEHLIRFVNGKTELLKDVSLGQKIKVFTSLRGGEWEDENGVKEYRNSLLGWDVEILEQQKPAINNNEQEETNDMPF